MVSSQRSQPNPTNELINDFMGHWTTSAQLHYEPKFLWAAGPQAFCGSRWSGQVKVAKWALKNDKFGKQIIIVIIVVVIIIIIIIIIYIYVIYVYTHVF